LSFVFFVRFVVQDIFVVAVSSHLGSEGRLEICTQRHAESDGF